MSRTCEYCGSAVGDGERFCPGCGAPLSAPAASAEDKAPHRGTPQTIDELLAFCQSHHMPLEKMRFFIGRDLRGSRAFGIYRDKRGDFVVYKNKSDGTRAVRYQGPDEAYAVREIYRKLQEEVALRKASSPASRSGAYPARSAGAYPSRSASSASSNYGRKKRSGLKHPILLIVGIVFLILLLFAIFDKSPTRGYYRYGNDYYYYQNDNWYLYDYARQSWQHAYDIDEELSANSRDYYSSITYDDDYDFEDFSDTAFYDSGSSGYGSGSGSSSYSWDSNDSSWDYDYDSWDSNDTDWDTDW